MLWVKIISMSTSYFIIFVFIVILGGAIWRMQLSRLARSLFGTNYRLRYIPSRWVIETIVNGRTIKYTTGGLGFLPALTYLFLESKVSIEFSVTKDRESSNIPEQIKTVIMSIQSRNGFKRLDVIRTGTSWLSTADRVTFLSHPGEGIMLRRFTKFGGNPDFIKKDLESLQRISDALMHNNKIP